MSSMTEILAKRSANREQVKSDLSDAQKARQKQKFERTQRRQVARAVGVDVDDAENIDTRIKEIGTLLNLQEQIEVELKRGDLGDETEVDLNRELPNVNAALDERTAGTDPFILYLAECARYAGDEGDDPIASPKKLIELGMRAIEEFGVARKIDEIEVQARKDARKDLREKVISEISPKLRGRFWTVFDQDTSFHITPARFSRSEKDEIDRATAFGRYFDAMMQRFLQSRRDHKRNLDGLDQRATLTPDEAFSGESGILKIEIIEGDSWLFKRPGDAPGERSGKAFGVIYLSVERNVLVVEATKGGPIWGTLRFYRAVERDVPRKRISFGMNFSNLRAQDGEELKFPGGLQALLCKAAGISKQEEEDEDGAPSAPTATMIAMSKASDDQKKRVRKTAKKAAKTAHKKRGSGRPSGGEDGDTEADVEEHIGRRATGESK